MRTRLFRTSLIVVVVLFCSVLLPQRSGGGFVRVFQGKLMLGGARFRFGGANSYLLGSSPHRTVDQVLETAVRHHLDVLRMWAFDDTATPSGFFWLQSFSNGAPVYNDTSTGLANVDYSLYRAGQLGLKLILCFTNNWSDYGGMDQYVAWRGLPDHDQFYTDAAIGQWYRAWVAHVLNHVNTISGIAYKNDPAIGLLELANEPECAGGNLPASGTCTVATIAQWAGTMASYIKSVDSNHPVGIGAEGFFCDPQEPSSHESCQTGTDNTVFAQIPSVDVLGFHLYPGAWGQSAEWARTFIARQLTTANAAGKPVYLGEFGSEEGNVRNPTYAAWTGQILAGGGSGALVWNILPGSPPPAAAESLRAYDFEDGSPVLSTLGNFAWDMTANQSLPHPPVAGIQWANAPFHTAVTLYPLKNDVAYGGAQIVASSIDLDPNTPGRQTSVSIYGGAFQVVGEGVQFTPADGFNGKSQSAYTVTDSLGKPSSVGYLVVNVFPTPEVPYLLESFEFDSGGWGPQNGARGAVTQTPAFHTDGTHGVQVVVKQGGAFGRNLLTPVNLAGRPSISIDVRSMVNGKAALAFQSGKNYAWCQNTTDQSVQAGSTATLTIPLQGQGIDCNGGSSNPADVRALWVMLQTPGVYYLDHLRALSSR